jgi:F-type H+-transporting ATPase subunit gamma
MATLREIRSRINTVKNIAKITQAMKLVAAARLNRAQQRVQAARPYAEMMQHVMEQLSTAAGEISHPLLEVREERNIAVILMTSDRGLCGSYNSHLIRKAMELLHPRDPATARLVLMGRKGVNFYRRQPYPIELQLGLNAGDPTFADVVPAVQKVRELFETEQVDSVYLVYSRFVNPMSQIATILQLLPLRHETVSAGPAPGAAGRTAPAVSARETLSTEVSQARRELSSDMILFEPAADRILSRLLPRYVDTQVYRALVEAVASEHGARMTSMTAATQNAGDMIDRLTLQRNRARQAAITKEIAEIVGGAEALK